jgi:hypothetical protein
MQVHARSGSDFRHAELYQLESNVNDKKHLLLDPSPASSNTTTSMLQPRAVQSCDAPKHLLH